MKTLRIFIIASIIAVVAISANAGMLEKRHQIDLKLGMWNQVADTRTEIGLTSVKTTVDNSGAMGGLTYGYWLQENLALNISVSGFSADVEVDDGVLYSKTTTASVAAIMMGLKYHFLKSSATSPIKPFIRADVGTFIGDQTKTEVGLTVLTESRTEAAMGGQLGVGTDFVISRHFITGVNFGYNFMTDFDNPIGGSDNYSGPEFSFSFGILLGKGVE